MGLELKRQCLELLDKIDLVNDAAVKEGDLPLIAY
jgi:hypothetical protein